MCRWVKKIIKLERILIKILSYFIINMFIIVFIDNDSKLSGLLVLIFF